MPAMTQLDLDSLIEEFERELEERALLDARLDELLDEESVGPALADEDLSGGFRARLRLEPRLYQREAIERWIASQGRGVVVLPTGAGKTVVALMAIERLKLRTLIVVPTIELLHQWRNAVIDRLGLPRDKVGVIGDGLRQLRPVTVITYASAAMPESPIGGFGLLICDEVHHLPAPGYATIALRSACPYRLGLTATPERSDGAHHALASLIGPEVYRRGPADLAAEGHIAQYREQRIFVDLSPEEQARYEALMTEWRWYLAAHRRTLARGGDFFGELIRRSGSDPQARRALQAHHQARMIALNAEAKLSELAGLLSAHRPDKVIVFSEYNALVETISRRFALPSITYKTAPDERKLILERFRDGTYSKIVTGRVLNEGVDVPDANVAIVVSGSAATREYIQRLGRVLRPKPTEAVLYELITRRTTEVRTARRRRSV